ncbi:MAG: c-type cytochrome, partial [Chitinophagaceae bacterium]
MNYSRPILRLAPILLFIVTIFCFNQTSVAQDGKVLFTSNCGGCHAVNKKLNGPALKDFNTRGKWADRKELYSWIHNPVAYMAKDPYTTGLKAEYGVMMQAFPTLSDKEIDAIAEYLIKASAAPAPGAATGEVTQDAKGQQDDNTLLFGILTLILAVIALILLQVNSNLKKLSDDAEGVPSVEPVPFYRNKAYIYIITLIIFVIGGYYTIQGAIGLGRTKNYQPIQPIYYSHKVHAGKNQISCLYCHGGAMEGKHANIPSVNVCMNCHVAINEYGSNSPKLYTEDGTEVNGTAEIKKLYDYAGWDGTKYVNEGKPVEWVRIHNLPDHVYFNHS